MNSFVDGPSDPDWFRKVDTIREILASSGRTLVQESPAWLWARSPVTFPIPGIRTVVQAQENCQAMNFGPLLTDQMAEIDRLLDRTS